MLNYHLRILVVLLVAPFQYLCVDVTFKDGPKDGPDWPPTWWQDCGLESGQCCVPVDLSLDPDHRIWHAFQPKEVHTSWIAAGSDDDKPFLPYLQPRTGCQGLSAVEMKHADYPSDFGNWRPDNPDDVISSVSFGRYSYKEIVFPTHIDFMGEGWWLEEQYHGHLRTMMFPLRYKSYTTGHQRVIYGRPQLSNTWCKLLEIPIHRRLILMRSVMSNNLSIPSNEAASRSSF